ncbi:MAG: hypothetical protein A4E37_01876 [Methanoregulaceae archaeon PtaB.Bin056]|jgi:hypothetical protein|nr:MAG: hypothetical protein A4E37_01876 [Methanoregulaceae archaeon PtaB.Bin056]
MRRELLIFAVVISLIAASGAVAYALLSGPASARIVSVSTDKDLYHSRDTMKISVSIESEGDLGNATLQLRGIEDRHGDCQLHKEIPVTVSKGSHIQVYDHKLPACSSCSGLNAGNYTINATLVQNGVPVSYMTHSFRLEQ